MKIRSFLLVVCMVVVPLIAMFSHRIPSGTRAAVASFLRDMVALRPAAAPAARVAASGDVTTSTVPVQPAAAPVSPRGVPVNQAAVSEPAGMAPRVVPVAAALPEAEAFGHLRALGVVAIECRPLAGHDGHVASCRVPVDGSGQLERVFQAVGADATAAAESLLRDVTAWKAGASGAGATRVPRRGTMRF